VCVGDVGHDRLGACDRSGRPLEALDGLVLRAARHAAVCQAPREREPDAGRAARDESDGPAGSRPDPQTARLEPGPEGSREHTGHEPGRHPLDRRREPVALGRKTSERPWSAASTMPLAQRAASIRSSRPNRLATIDDCGNPGVGTGPGLAGGDRDSVLARLRDERSGPGRAACLEQLYGGRALERHGAGDGHTFTIPPAPLDELAATESAEHADQAEVVQLERPAVVVDLGRRERGASARAGATG